MHPPTRIRHRPTLRYRQLNISRLFTITFLNGIPPQLLIFNREALGIDVDFTPPPERVIRSLEQIISWRGCPGVIRCDNGPEYISAALQGWANRRGIRIECIKPRNPRQSAYVERFNRTVRYEWLAQYLFDTVSEVQDFATRSL